MGKLTINLCEELHQRIREDVAADESLTTGLLMERIIRAHYEGPKPRSRIESGGRTMAFSVSEELSSGSSGIWRPTGASPSVIS